MKGVVLRFRVMAIWAGVMSLLLWFGYMPAKYLVNSDTFYQSFIWIPILHGFTYPLYLLTAAHLAIYQRKSLLSTALFLLAGTLPITSFWIERQVRAGR